MDQTPQLSREEFITKMREKFEAVMGQVADAINDAPGGRVIADSEEKVRDLMGEFRQQAYELGLQMRSDAAEAAFPPSAGSGAAEEATQ